MLSMSTASNGASPRKRMLYQVGNILYLLGWGVTLAGLALIQDECKDHVRSTDNQFLGYENIAFFNEPVGRDCNKGYRFFWFVWALSTIPPLLAVVASFMPDMARGASTSFFAVLAPLTILMANSFYDATWVAKSDMEKRMEVATAGFCVLGGASLLMLLLDSLLVSKPDNKSVPHDDHDHDRSTHRKSANLDYAESQHHTHTTKTTRADAIVGIAHPALATEPRTGAAVPGAFVEPAVAPPVIQTPIVRGNAQRA